MLGKVTPRGALRIEPADIQRVLDTAAQLFATHGFDSVGIRDIARESGVTMPSIYLKTAPLVLLKSWTDNGIHGETHVVVGHIHQQGPHNEL